MQLVQLASSKACAINPAGVDLLLATMLSNHAEHAKHSFQLLYRSLVSALIIFGVRAAGEGAGAVRQRGSPGAGLPEDHTAPHLREVHGAQVLIMPGLLACMVQSATEACASTVRWQGRRFSIWHHDYSWNGLLTISGLDICCIHVKPDSRLLKASGTGPYAPQVC